MATVESKEPGRIAFTKFTTDHQKETTERVFAARPGMEAIVGTDGKIAAYRIGIFDDSQIIGIKDFTLELLEKRVAFCKQCAAYDEYQYQGAELGFCTKAKKPNCRFCHSEILNNLEPCPLNILPIE